MARNKKTKVAMYPGSFDPITYGHIDIIRRASDIFDKVIVAIGENPAKNHLLPQDIRIKLMQKAVANLKNVEVATYRGLTVNFARKKSASVIIRGLRNGADFSLEYQSAMTNLDIGKIETLFLPSSPKYSFISSTLVRQVANAGGNISSMTPNFVAAAIKASKNQRSKS